MGDMRERLKEIDNKEELNSINIKKLNLLIEDCLRNRKNSTNYRMLYEISRRMSNEICIPNRYNEPIQTEMDAETVKKIALDFFRSIDEEFYKKARAIINQETSIEFKMYKKEEIKDYEEKEDDGIPKYSKVASVHNNGKRTVMFIPLNGTIEDIYLLVHEISHTFDLNIENDSRNGTRNILGEVTPAVFEALLSEYFIKSGNKKQDVYRREKGGTISKYDDGVETYTKLVLMDLIKRKGEITIEDIQKIQKEANLGTDTIKYILGRLLNSPADVDYRARYMIAQLAYPYIVDKYKREPQKTMEEIKKYFRAIQENDFGNALESLGLSVEEHTIDLLISINNDRIKCLEGKIEETRRECI